MMWENLANINVKRQLLYIYTHTHISHDTII